MLLVVLLAGCIRFGEDAVGEYKEGQYKEWLDFRFHTLVIQEVDLAFESHEVVALVTVENIGNSTPGLDSPWAFLSATIMSRSVEGPDNDHVSLVSIAFTGEGGSDPPPRFFSSAAAERRGVSQETQYRAPFPPRATRTLELAEWVPGSSSSNDHLWFVDADVQSGGALSEAESTTTGDHYLSGCQVPEGDEFYGGWNGMRCAHTRTCRLAFFQECPSRPVQAKYYGHPDDEGIPPGPAWLEP